MLNNLFGANNIFKNSKLSKIFMKTSSKYCYNMYIYILKIFNAYSKNLTKKFGELYVVYLQNNKLSFYNLSNLIKQLFIYTAIAEAWASFFKNVKNISNIYILREQKHLMVYKLICLFYKTKIVYYNELNIKYNFSKTIANFYNDISVQNAKNKKFNLILFYYFNKIALTNHPYFYWTYFNVYSKNSNINANTSKSKHTKSALFFLYINLIKKFYLQKTKISFIKTKISTFKGFKVFFKNIENKVKIDMVPAKKLMTGVKWRAKRVQGTLLEYDSLKNYNNFFKKIKTKYSFYINSIIYKNIINNNTNVFIKTKVKFLQITWYNKIHNTIIEIKKNTMILFLRSSKHFNKGRYSRNRQLYRTGVYWCIWLNVIIVYSLYFYFYRVVFSFGYLWLPLGLIILTMFSSRLYKYRYYNVKQIFLEFLEFNNFVYNNIVNVKTVWKQNLKNALIKLSSLAINYIFLLKKLI